VRRAVPPLLCSQLKTDLRLALPPCRSGFPQFASFASFSPVFFPDASAISFGIAAKKMRKNRAAWKCEKPAEMLWICHEKPVENAVDILRQSGGLAVDNRAKRG